MTHDEPVNEVTNPDVQVTSNTDNATSNNDNSDNNSMQPHNEEATTTIDNEPDNNEATPAAITVAVRVRPLTEKERGMMATEPQDRYNFNSSAALSSSDSNNSGSSLRKVISVIDDRMLVFDPPVSARSTAGSGHGFGGTRLNTASGGRRSKDVRFAFDRVFNEEATQEQVFSGTTKQLITSVLNGFNATVFAYGATGCGKTHTISGTPDDPGIIFLTMRELFEKIQANEEEIATDISISYLEVYNETICDLLISEGGRGRPLALREDQNGVMVAGLSEHHPKTPDEVMRLLLLGNKNRAMSPTCANAVSSRSHAVLQVNIRRRPRTASISSNVTVATMSIIDLAGSERASVTKNTGGRLLEGASINRSLLALGNCINALCDERKSAHIPYRDSKLTRLLKFSLGGNCRTVMIVCVSPCSIHYEETHNTLKYANRAKNIKTNVARNTVNVTMHVSQYRRIITELKGEVAELKRKLRLSRGTPGTSNAVSRPTRPTATSAVSAPANNDHGLSPSSRSAVDKELQRLARVYTASHSIEGDFAECAFAVEACQQQREWMSFWCKAFDECRSKDPNAASSALSFYQTAEQISSEAATRATQLGQQRDRAEKLLSDQRAVASQIVATSFPGMRRRERELAQREFNREHDRLELMAANIRLEKALAASQQQLMRISNCINEFAKSNALQLSSLRTCLRMAETWGPEGATCIASMNDIYMQAIQSFTSLTQLINPHGDTSTSTMKTDSTNDNQSTLQATPMSIDSNDTTTSSTSALTSASTSSATNTTTSNTTIPATLPSRSTSVLGSGTQGQLDYNAVTRMLAYIRHPPINTATSAANSNGNQGAPQRSVTIQRVVSSPARRRRLTPVKSAVMTGARRLAATGSRTSSLLNAALTSAANANATASSSSSAAASNTLANGGARRVLVSTSKSTKDPSPIPMRSSLKDPNRPRRPGGNGKSVVIISPRTEAAMQSTKRPIDDDDANNESEKSNNERNAKTTVSSSQSILNKRISPPHLSKRSRSSPNSSEIISTRDSNFFKSSSTSTTTTITPPEKQRNSRLSPSGVGINGNTSGPIRDTRARRRSRAMEESFISGVLGRLERNITKSTNPGDVSLLSLPNNDDKANVSLLDTSHRANSSILTRRRTSMITRSSNIQNLLTSSSSSSTTTNNNNTSKASATNSRAMQLLQSRRAAAAASSSSSSSKENNDQSVIMDRTQRRKRRQTVSTDVLALPKAMVKSGNNSFNEDTIKTRPTRRTSGASSNSSAEKSTRTRPIWR